MSGTLSPRSRIIISVTSLYIWTSTHHVMKAYLQRYISNKRNKLDFIHNSLANSKTKTWGDSVELAYIGIRIDKYACEMKARPDHEESRVLVSGGPARGKCTYRYTNWRSQSLQKNKIRVQYLSIANKESRKMPCRIQVPSYTYAPLQNTHLCHRNSAKIRSS